MSDDSEEKTPAESAPEPGSEGSEAGARPEQPSRGFLWAVAVGLVLVGGIGGYLWHELGWWPAESAASELTAAERTWCSAQADLLALSAFSLDLLSTEFLEGNDVGGEDDPVNGSVLFQYQGNYGRSQIDPARQGDLATLGLQSYVLGQNWILEKTDGWSDPDVVVACAAAYEAFR